MLLTNSGISPRSVAELALVVSRLGYGTVDRANPASPSSIRTFWQSHRQLQQRWMKLLDAGSTPKLSDLTLLERLAPRIFTCEMLVRTWGTYLAALDRQQGSTDLTRICRNIVTGLFQLRLELLSRLICLSEAPEERIRSLDRLRRQCDRSTDLLVGMVGTDADPFEFAFDPERARDFHESAVVVDPGIWPNPVEDLVSAGLRLNFIQQLTAEPVDEPEFAIMMQSILASLPDFDFTRNRVLRKSLEWKIATSLC